MPRRSKPLPPASQYVVLALLEGEMHGYVLMRRVQDQSDGAVRMGPGTLYGTLNPLVKDGLIVETTDHVPRADSERRRYYELTGTGRSEAMDELALAPGSRPTCHPPSGRRIHGMSRDGLASSAYRGWSGSIRAASATSTAPTWRS